MVCLIWITLVIYTDSLMAGMELFHWSKSSILKKDGLATEVR